MPLDELASPEFVANTVDRCYHCKSLRMRGIIGRAREIGLPNVVDGANADDAKDWRPNISAFVSSGCAITATSPG